MDTTPRFRCIKVYSIMSIKLRHQLKGMRVFYDAREYREINMFVSKFYLFAFRLFLFIISTPPPVQIHKKYHSYDLCCGCRKTLIWRVMQHAWSHSLNIRSHNCVTDLSTNVDSLFFRLFQLSWREFTDNRIAKTAVDKAEKALSRVNLFLWRAL